MKFLVESLSFDIIRYQSNFYQQEVTYLHIISIVITPFVALSLSNFWNCYVKSGLKNTQMFI